MAVYVGTSGFSYAQWKGGFYPEQISAKRMLAFYGEHFCTVEINNSFYRMPKSEVLQRWKQAVSPGFRFAFKASRRITHQKRLEDAAQDVEYLASKLEVLQDQLGPVLFQPPPYLRKDAPRLSAFLEVLPPRIRAAFEFRHRSWFDDEIYELLQGAGACLCISDREQDGDLEPPWVPTTDWGYVRLRREHYSEPSLQSWARRIADQWDEAHVFFMHEDEGQAPVLAQRFQAMIG